MKNWGRNKYVFLIDEMHLRALIVLQHYKQKQQKVIYFRARYILHKSIFSNISEKRLKFPIISVRSPRHNKYDLSLLKGITNWQGTSNKHQVH
jgi:hypothetical protein